MIFGVVAGSRAAVVAVLHLDQHRVEVSLTADGHYELYESSAGTKGTKPKFEGELLDPRKV